MLILFFRCALLAALAAPAWAQGDLVALIAAAKPSVVALGTFNPTDSPRFGFRGTGFAVGDGTLVVTNFHVLPPGVDSENAPRFIAVSPRTPTGPVQRTARVVATDRVHDLALLKVDGTPLPPLALAEGELAPEGTSIALIGFPIAGALGFSPVTHKGILAAVTGIAPPVPTAQQLNERAVARMREGNFEIYQLDAIAYPGNSGGPVFDVARGQVLGVISSVAVKEGRESALSRPTGISYAVPVRHVLELLKAR